MSTNMENAKSKGHKWKAGEPSPNPRGAPQKDESLTFLMKKFLKNIPEGQTKTYKQIFIEKVYHKAVKDGDVASIKLIFNYVDGMPQQKLDMTSQGEKLEPTQIIIQNYGSGSSAV